MEQSIKKHAVKRTIRYWGYYAVRMFFVILLMAVIYGVIFTRGERDSMQAMIISVFFYLAIMEGIMILILPLSYVGSNFSLVISMGSGRKEAFWGIQFTNLLFYIQTIIALSIGGRMYLEVSESIQNLSTPEVWKMWAVLLAGVFWLVAVGQIGAWLSLRYGMRGNIIYTIGFVLMIFGGVVGIGAFVVKAARAGSMLQMGLQGTGMLIFVAALIVYAVGFGLLKKTVMHYEVQR